jgi:peptidoglycan/LPS O-acetylase OafA/YrhL
MTARRFRYASELDSIRGVALVLVVLAHLWIIWPTWTFHSDFSDGGFLGADLFFVLSGFLITGLLLDEEARTGRVRLRSFYWRRALRILPPLWFYLAAHAVYSSVAGYPPLGHRSDEVASVLAAALFHMNWRALWDPNGTTDLSPMWTLAIEVQFYLVWPLVIVLCAGLRRHAWTVISVIGGLFVLATFRRHQLFHDQGWEAAYLRSDSHMDGLLLGSLAGCAYVRGWTPDRLPRWLLWVAAVGGIAVFLPARADQGFAYDGGTTMFLICSATVVLVAASSGRRTLGPFGRVTAALGQLSYGIYLWHYAALWAVTRWGQGRSDELRLFWTVVIIAAGTATSRLVFELPFLRRKPPRPGAAPERLIPAFGGPPAARSGG